MKSRFELDQAAAEQAPERGPGKFKHSEPTDPNSTQRRYVDPESPDPESPDPESYDASEHHFAISLEERVATSSPFIVEEQQPDHSSVSGLIPVECDKTLFVPAEIASSRDECIAHADSKERDSLKVSNQLKQPASEAGVPWRQEVSARLTRYQARRRAREPRYPSLQLKFEAHDAWRGPSPVVGSVSASIPNNSAVAKNSAAAEPLPREVPPPPLPTRSTGPAPRVIEFPRSSTAGPSHSEELAEPVFDRPRIMEAPELVPVPPSLGGILIEPSEAPANEKRPGFEMPLQGARMARRLAATLIDSMIVFVGLALFACIFWQVAASIPSIHTTASITVVVGAILWATYQYLLVVHCGTTPGLKMAKLKLSHFDGTAVHRKMRRWRLLASVLSGLSLGLGYAWCFLDEDQLCWHDRITRTYMAPKA